MKTILKHFEHTVIVALIAMLAIAGAYFVIKKAGV